MRKAAFEAEHKGISPMEPSTAVKPNRSLNPSPLFRK